jgi:hypothetical protein
MKQKVLKRINVAYMSFYTSLFEGTETIYQNF